MEIKLEPMHERQIEALFAKRTRNSISRIVSPRQDLKFSQLKIYYEATGREPNAQFLKNLELFTDRLEITSTGSIPQGMSEAEFFEGYSVPRNKELMRIFRDLDMVEYLGSGMPRILRTYPKECFRFTENFTRMIFPFTVSEPAGQVTGQVEPWMILVLKACVSPLKSSEIQKLLEVKHRETFQRNYLDRLLEAGLIERTIPEKPNSRLQKYRRTEKGRSVTDHSCLPSAKNK